MPSSSPFIASPLSDFQLRSTFILHFWQSTLGCHVIRCVVALRPSRYMKLGFNDLQNIGFSPPPIFCVLKASQNPPLPLPPLSAKSKKGKTCRAAAPPYVSFARLSADFLLSGFYPPSFSGLTRASRAILRYRASIVLQHNKDPRPNTARTRTKSPLPLVDTRRDEGVSLIDTCIVEITPHADASVNFRSHRPIPLLAADPQSSSCYLVSSSSASGLITSSAGATVFLTCSALQYIISGF